MKIVIDDKIPYIRGVFEPYAEVVYKSGSATTNEVVRDADAIVTRTRTICNKDLLHNSSVKFIATATIGYDHIDTNYCDEAGIRWTNAPGCNSGSVEQYIASALVKIAQKFNWDLSKKNIGIVGVGNVGRKVEKIARMLGMNVLLNDPPRERAENSNKFVSLQTVIDQADVISLHVPLSPDGEDATWHLANESFFNELKKQPVLINSCRGEVVDTNAIIYALEENKISTFVCDCWENEPCINRNLLKRTFLATPHIAGYSKDGKAVGTQMTVQAISEYFHLGIDKWKPVDIETPEIPRLLIDGIGLTDQQVIFKAILHTYDIEQDDILFRKSPDMFENIRGDYRVRREFGAYTLQLRNVSTECAEKLTKIGFNVLL